MGWQSQRRLLRYWSLAAIVLMQFGPTSSPESPENTANTDNGVPNAPALVDTSFGAANFTTKGGLGDTLSLTVSELGTPPDGYDYQVWLVNTDNNTTLNVGTLILDAMGNGSLSYSEPNGVFLPAVFNAVLVTAENSNALVPTGEVEYYGQIPATVAEALFNILLSSPQAIDERGLLASAIAEAYITNEQVQNAGEMNNMGIVLTHSERTINTLFGAANDYNGDGQSDNPGFGVGLPTLLDEIEAQLDAIVNAPDASPRIQTNAEFIRACVTNTRTRMDRISELESAIVAADSPDAVQSELDELSETVNELLAGVDQNENGRIEGFVGECGLSQIAGFTLLIGTMSIDEGNLPTEQLVSAAQAFEFTPGVDFCLDTELTFGISKDAHTDM